MYHNSYSSLNFNKNISKHHGHVKLKPSSPPLDPTLIKTTVRSRTQSRYYLLFAVREPMMRGLAVPPTEIVLTLRPSGS